MSRKSKTGHSYYPRYPTIYANITHELTLEEHGALSLLFDHYMLYRQALPGNFDSAMADILHCSPRTWRRLKTKLVSFFETRDDGGLWYNSLCEESLTESNSRIENARINGKTGGRPRKDVETENPLGSPKEKQAEQSKQAEENNKSSGILSSQKQADDPNGMMLMEYLKGEKRMAIPFYEIAKEYSANDERISYRWETFICYWQSNEGRKVNWLAAWRSWLLITIERESYI